MHQVLDNIDSMANLVEAKAYIHPHMVTWYQQMGGLWKAELS